MHIRFSALAGAAALVLALGGCAYMMDDEEQTDSDSPSMTAAEVATKDFSKISAAGPDAIIVKTGPEIALTATGDSKTLEQLVYTVEDGRLKISRKNRNSFNWSSGDGATITVIMPKLESIAMAGSGDASVEQMDGADVRITSAGSGSIKVAKVTAKNLTSKSAGSGNVMLAGTADKAELAIAGSGSMIGPDLMVAEAEISIAGSGSVDLKSDGKVSAKIAGSGNVNVRGKAKCSSKSMGSGTVTCGE